MYGSFNTDFNNMLDIILLVCTWLISYIFKKRDNSLRYLFRWEEVRIITFRRDEVRSDYL